MGNTEQDDFPSLMWSGDSVDRHKCEKEDDCNTNGQIKSKSLKCLEFQNIYSFRQLYIYINIYIYIIET